MNAEQFCVNNDGGIEMDLLDIIASEEAKTAAIDQVEAAADPRWMNTVYQIIVQLATASYGGFTTDQVWDVLDRSKIESPTEPRAMGAVFRQACADGLIVATGEYRPSARPVCHASPKRVWRRA